MSSRPVNFWDGDTSRIPSAPLVVAPGSQNGVVSCTDEMEAQNQDPLKIWTRSLSSCFLIVSFSFFHFVCPYLVVCLFVFNNKKNSHVAPWPPVGRPSWVLQQIRHFQWTAQKGQDQPRIWPKEILPRIQMFPIFSVEVFEFFDPSGKISMKNPRLHGEISKNPSEIWTLNRSSVVFVEKKTVFPGLHKCGERHGLPGISKTDWIFSCVLVGNKVIH